MQSQALLSRTGTCKLPAQQESVYCQPGSNTPSTHTPKRSVCLQETFNQKNRCIEIVYKGASRINLVFQGSYTEGLVRFLPFSIIKKVNWTLTQLEEETVQSGEKRTRSLIYVHNVLNKIRKKLQNILPKYSNSVYGFFLWWIELSIQHSLLAWILLCLL